MQNDLVGKRARRKIGGFKAKAFGSLFEDLFLMNCKRYHVGVTQIPDSCKQVTHTKIYRVKSPFDWVLTYQGKSAMIDTKTTMDNFSRSDISEHQVKELLIHESSGGIGGYVIWFRERDLVLFMPASSLHTLKRAGIGPSINEAHPSAILLGSPHDFQIVRIFK